MEPTGSHETVSGKLATQIGIILSQRHKSWFIPRTCLIRPSAEIATARRPNIIVLDEAVLALEPFWEKEPVITLTSSIKLVFKSPYLLSSVFYSSTLLTRYFASFRRSCLISK